MQTSRASGIILEASEIAVDQACAHLQLPCDGSLDDVFIDKDWSESPNSANTGFDQQDVFSWADVEELTADNLTLPRAFDIHSTHESDISEAVAELLKPGDRCLSSVMPVPEPSQHPDTHQSQEFPGLDPFVFDELDPAQCKSFDVFTAWPHDSSSSDLESFDIDMPEGASIANPVQNLQPALLVVIYRTIYV